MKTEVQPAVWPECHSGTLYDYCFSVWPIETHPKWNPSTFQLFGMLTTRLVMEFTESEFNDFREEIAKVGIDLREIERAPHLETKVVY